MTKKDYIAVAAAINSQVSVTYRGDAIHQALRAQTLQDVAEQLCIVFARENARFSHDRFLVACGVKK
jgi:hypothetical protein